jgi:methylated-DNA-[protein]-cysteine S-methyltransferase
MASMTITTPIGPFTVLARGGAVLASGFTDDLDVLRKLVPHKGFDGDADLDRIAGAVRAYFAGELSAIDAIAVEQHSGPFLEQSWEVLRAVPAGAPLTYTAFAAKAGRPAAVRAAAQACARNAAALFVPCHRIVRTDGALGGYRWGIEIKRWLLDHESETGS